MLEESEKDIKVIGMSELFITISVARGSCSILKSVKIISEKGYFNTSSGNLPPRKTISLILESVSGKFITRQATSVSGPSASIVIGEPDPVPLYQQDHSFPDFPGHFHCYRI